MLPQLSLRGCSLLSCIPFWDLLVPPFSGLSASIFASSAAALLFARESHCWVYHLLSLVQPPAVLPDLS